MMICSSLLHRLVLAALQMSDEVCFHTLVLHRLVLAALQVSDEVCFHTCLVCAVVACKVLLFQVYQLDVASSAGAAGADGVTVAAQPAAATDVSDALTSVCRHLQQEQHTVAIATVFVRGASVDMGMYRKQPYSSSSLMTEQRDDVKKAFSNTCGQHFIQ